VRLAFLLIALATLAPPARAACGPLWHGADVSMLAVLEAAGAPFANATGQRADVLALLRGAGANTVRLRLWHTPADTPEGRGSTLTGALALARRATAAGLCVGLTLHYSDTWADPAAQTRPQAWAALSFPALVDSVRAYTARVTGAFVQQGTPPAFVGTGNEITGGMLWPEGRVGGSHDTPAQWQRLGALLRAAGEGVRAAAPGTPVVLHLDRGGDAAGATWFFDRVRAENVSFDAAGLSYYPWWHGSPEALSATLDAVATRYDVPVFVAETAYPWTTAWNDATHNPVGTQPLDAFPASPEGQAAFVRDVRVRVAATSGGHGAGVLYWAPEWTTAPGVGSPWENLATFDFSGRALPALAALGTASTGTAAIPSMPRLVVAPQPAQAGATVRVSGVAGPWQAVLVDALGRTVATFSGTGNGMLTAPAPGVYALRLMTGEHGSAVRPVVVR
jgi:arabinogalactan endo-1,4-beta-galactosidase